MPYSPSTPTPPAPELLKGPVAQRLGARCFRGGDRIVLLGHGFGTDQTAWRRVIPALTRRHTVITYDLACVREETFLSRNYRHLADYADDLVALMDEQDVRGAAFVGHSVSGMIGALASLSFPAGFSQLILLNPSPRYLDDENYVGGFSRDDLDTLYSSMRSDYQAWVAGFAPAAIGIPGASAIREFTESFLAMRPDITLAVAQTIFESDLRDILPSIALPTTIIHTRADIAAPPSIAAYFRTHLPGVRSIQIDTDGHLPHLSASDLVAQALETALAA